MGGIVISILICLASVSAITVPITYLMALISGETYDRICDNSEIVYQLNRIGKWTILVLIGSVLSWSFYLLIL